MTATVTNYLGLPDLGGPPDQVARVVNRLLQGKMNNVAEVTLTANSTTTTLNDVRIGAFSLVVLQPITADATSEGIPQQSGHADGSCTLTHANDASTTRTYRYAVFG